MSQFYEYNWPATTANGISLFQELTTNTPLLLNGFYVNKTTGTVNFVDDFGIVPYITLNSASDLSAINFLITGYQNGVFISETLKGPTTNATVTSKNCFDTVVQIIPNTTSVSTIQVGVAALGYFPIILLNIAKINTSSTNYALNIIPTKNNPPSYQIFLSLKNNLGLGKYDDLTSDANGNFISFKEPSNEAVLINSNNLAQNLLIKIAKNDANSSLKAQFLQL